MKRFDDWQTRLTAYLRSVAHKPFVFGTHDCFIFTGECVRAMTGDNYIDQFAGKYKNIEEADEIARSIGFRGHLHWIARKFEARRSPLHMQRGDIAVSRSLSEGPVLGICQGGRVYAAGENGLMTYPADHVRKAFAV